MSDHMTVCEFCLSSMPRSLACVRDAEATLCARMQAKAAKEARATVTDEIYVVTWRYGDKSANGLVRAFRSEEAAKDLRDVLDRFADGGREFEVDAVRMEPK